MKPVHLMFQLHPIPAFKDNYIWTLNDGRHALVVDPGEAVGVNDWLEQQGLALSAILLTHHHADHTGGVAELRDQWKAPVYGPLGETLPEPVARLDDGDRLTMLGIDFDVLHVPGHTAGHIAYLAAPPGMAPLLFCGDTLFSGGCGRLFEGTPAQMLDSLDRLASLPDDTQVCCTHEYTLSNLRFAQAVEPDNPDLAAYMGRCESLRQRNLPTLPSSIGLERLINPFLRCRAAAVRHVAERHAGAPLDSAAAVLGALREWKNVF